MQKRLNWIDQARGLSIFLVVYGHNFPVNEPYIYSFHVPLFFFIAGMFHPKNEAIATIKRRAKMLLAPYFIWAFALFLFWWAIGRNYGESVVTDTSPIKNFIGIFYAQGGRDYMEWGIPMWFLPCVFLVFILSSAVKKIKNKPFSVGVSLLLIIAGFLWPIYFQQSLPWSLDVAMVALGFYMAGEYLKKWLIDLSKIQALPWFVLCITINILCFTYNPSKVDMYRSVYGNEALFFISGLSGAIAYVLLFKIIPIFSFLSYLGKHTIVLLATHIPDAYNC